MKQTYQLKINGKSQSVRAAPGTPLLWVLREQVQLTGTKYGCGVGQCGACTIHIDGKVQRSCVLPVDAIGPDQEIVTIEGLVADSPDHPVLLAWAEMDVPQCGYCQTGQIMAATQFLNDTPKPNTDEIRAGMMNYCRCGTYNAIAAAISRAADLGNK